MKKILAALVAGIVGVVGVFFARAEGLVTAQAVSDILFGLWYSALAVVLSWFVTAFAGSRHRAWAMGSAGGLMLIGGIYRWGAGVPIGWLAVSLIFAIASPFLFMVSEAVLARFGVVLRKGADGEVVGVKVDDEKTLFIGAPTERPDTTVPKDKPSDE